MKFPSLAVLSLPFLGSLAAPQAETCTEEVLSTSTPFGTTTTTVPITATVTNTVIPTAAAPQSMPTSAYTVISARSGSAIHLLPMNAGGQNFYLGGSPATYCPLTDKSLCPPGTDTALTGLASLDVTVPGGQQIYVAPGGRLGYTQAHSSFYPAGSDLSSLTYSKDPGAEFGILGTTAFGATGFMACPGNSTSETTWQVFAALQNATVPSGNVNDCLGFDALTSDYTANSAAAWQYT